MLLQPKKWKHRKQMTPPVTGIAKNGHYVAFGDFWLKSIDNWFVSNRQLEAARKVIVRSIRKIWKMRTRVFPDTPITKGWLEKPMGSGKGEVDKYVARIKRGKILFELGWVNKAIAYECLTKAMHKLSVRTRVVFKGEVR